MIPKSLIDPMRAFIAPGLRHIVCACDEDTALCGADVTAEPWEEDGLRPDCVVCEDLEFAPCPQCGCLPH